MKKHQNILIIAGVALAAFTLSACGTSGTINLSGAAGQPTEEDATNPVTEAPVVTEVPPTEIPAATGHIIFTSKRDGQTDLYMTDPTGAQVTRLTVNASVDAGSTPQLSPDGSKIAFVSTVNDNTDIYILDIASTIITRLTDAQEKDSSPSWSPDGQRVAFESFRDGNLEIYMASADGSNTQRLTNDPAGDSNPIWSPVSNDMILFVSNRFGNSDLFLLNPNGTVSTLTTSPTPDNTPSWSPDGNFIAFQSFTGDLANICLIGRDGLNQICLTSTVAEYGTPSWSHDGNWLATNAQINGQYSILVFNVKGGGSMVQLAQAGIEPRGTPTWAPDNLRVVFQAQSNGDMEIYQALIPTNEFTQITTMPGYDGDPVWSSN